MKASILAILCASALAVQSGCIWAPRAELNTVSAELRALQEQNRAQLVEIENLKEHSRRLEDRVINGDRDATQLQQQARLQTNKRR